jgi:transcriptional regulator with XRE-family HTH domain
MTRSRTARFLTNAIDRSGLTQRDVARRAGFNRPNIISMMKTGETKVPIDRIPGLAAALGVPAFDFIKVAMQEYQPEVWEILTKTLGAPLTKNEELLIFTLDLADPDEVIEFDQPTSNLLLAIFDHLQLEARRRRGGLALPEPYDEGEEDE